MIRIALALLGLALVLAVAIAFLSEGVTGRLHDRGEIATVPVPAERVAARGPRFADPSGDASGQILFGDLHVHTTFSSDAFVFSLPLMQGEGSHPPADACDFARFCAELDFWSINDHAENLTPRQWQETRESIRECNAVAGDSEAPDLVSFLGWEWTQSSPAGLPGSEQKAHYGHKNVILKDTADERTPARPIGAGAGGLFSADAPAPVWALLRAGMTIGDWGDDLSPYLDFNRYTAEVRGHEACPGDVPVRDLPTDCLEGADRPEELFAKLDDWGFPSLVIPHGTSWGIHAPPGADLALQLEPGSHDAGRQRLFEVYSGHGNSEQWFLRRDSVAGPDGESVCAEPAGGYLPCCWRAGEILAARCEARGGTDCEERARLARAEYLAAGDGPMARGVVPGTRPEDWLECGQFAGSFLPALDYRPGMSAQYALAARNPEIPGDDGAFRFGLIASSDNHKARPGAGYKETRRTSFSDTYGLRQDWLDRLSGPPQASEAVVVPADQVEFDLGSLDPGTERNASYYYTAGLVAVHADARTREGIWEALAARRVYGTSGPRILLWFDLQAPDGSGVPMGSLWTGSTPPRFVARAAGSFVQQPGCPDHVRQTLSPERLERLCRGECYHPGDERVAIEKIEVVRITPQRSPDEPMDGLIEDPWRVFSCPEDETVCEFVFEDPDYDGTREVLYYVRALQAPTPAVNGDPMRCRRGADGRCQEARLCPAGGPDFDASDDCLSPVAERAWSSPIWVLPGGSGASSVPGSRARLQP